jgi:hypothetical protein
MNPAPTADPRAFRFFRESAGGVVGEAAIGAIRLARAERLLRQAQALGCAAVEWQDDYDHGSMTDEDQAALDADDIIGPFGCVVQVGIADEDGNWTIEPEVASLWGITLLNAGAGHTDTYQRVVEAQLASELMDALLAVAEED